MAKKGSIWTEAEKIIVKKFCNKKSKDGSGKGAGKGLVHQCQAALLKKGFSRSIGAINNEARKYGGFTKRIKNLYAEKEKEIIKKYNRYGDGGLEEAVKELKNKGFNRTWQSVQVWAYNNGLNIGNCWTEEEETWLKSNNLFKGAMKNLCDNFLKKFPDCNRTALAIESKFNRLGYRLNHLWEPELESVLEKLRDNKKLSVEEIQKLLADAKEELEIIKIKEKREKGDYDKNPHSIINKCYSLKIQFQVSNDWEYWTEEELDILLDDSLTNKQISILLPHRTPAAISIQRRKLTNPMYKMIVKTRTIINGAIKNYIKNPQSYTERDTKATQILGCQINWYINEHILEHPDFVQKHWNLLNHGDVWHIDHEKELHKATTEEELTKLFHYTNTRPMWASTSTAEQHGVEGVQGNLNR
ncbi:hypothetical protein CMI37_10595 [Candidatus Pacearchaeota archaeon]|jgi:predicted nucleic acid-binding protein|nr:hypothetical protein [Candidatus Pacearchaeota archaeon]|tara:strand:- start:245 stop:1489 length:1245 start_codon:yes stop_codon:yes gene_type:complete